MARYTSSIGDYKAGDGRERAECARSMGRTDQRGRRRLATPQPYVGWGAAASRTTYARSSTGRLKATEARPSAMAIAHTRS
jgi:hypothetical protein